MSKLIFIVGDTGSGKTRSIKNLNPEETYLINVLNKPLPFTGDNYSEENDNMYCTSDYREVRNAIEGISQNRPKIKNLIIDDASFIMTTELFNRSSEKGYEKFTEIGLHMQKILETSKNQRNDLNIFFIFHEDDDESNRIKIKKKVKTIGQMLEDKYNPLGTTSICLFTYVDFDKDGIAKYKFITNRVLKDGIIYPAKSPEGMFEELYIENDLNLVINAINQYYSKNNNKIKKELIK